MGVFGPPNIERLKRRGNIKGLIKVMQSDKGGSIAAEAAKALGEIGDSSAIEPLLEEFRADHDHSSDAAVDALVQMAARMKDIDLTTQLLDRWIRDLCPGGITHSGGGVHYDGDDDEFNRAWAREDRRRMEDHRSWDMGAGRRQGAARALGLLRDPRAVAPLIRCLETHLYGTYDSHTRVAAIRALAKIGDVRALGPIQKCGNELEEMIREAARFALAALTTP